MTDDELADLLSRLQKAQHHFQNAIEGEYWANLFARSRFALECLKDEKIKAAQQANYAIIADLRARADLMPILHRTPYRSGGVDPKAIELRKIADEMEKAMAKSRN